MNAQRSPGPPTRLLAALLALLLAGCSIAPTPPARTPPVGNPTVAPSRTAGIVVRRDTPGLPTRGVATPELPQTTARDGAALVVQAIDRIIAEGLRPEGSAILYGAAYDGAVAALRRLGYLVEGDPPPFADERAADAARFTAAYLALASAPVVAINQTSLAYETIRAATDRLDECNTYLLAPRDYAARQNTAQTGEEYGGIGLTLRPGPAAPTIAAVYPDSPAARLGLRPGDEIAAIDGRATAALPLDQVGATLRGPVGAAITLTVARAGEPGARTVVLTREAIRPPALTATIATDPAGRPIGLLRTTALSQGAEQEIDRALATFAGAGVAGWILDLRETAGGPPDTLAAIAGRFLGGGQTVAYRTQRGSEETIIASGAASAPRRPLAVLINGGTTGTAELLAAALADAGLARLFGEPTAGCVSVATLFPLADGSALQVGTALLRSPARRDLAARGLQPDEVVWSRPATTADPPLVAALAWMSGRSGPVGEWASAIREEAEGSARLRQSTGPLAR